MSRPCMSTMQTSTVSMSPVATRSFRASKPSAAVMKCLVVLRVVAGGGSAGRRPVSSRSGVAVGPPRLLHRRVVVLEDLHDPRLGLRLRRDLVPELAGRGLDLRPLLVRNRGQFELGAVDSEVRHADPIPVLTVIVRLL